LDISGTGAFCFLMVFDGPGTDGDCVTGTVNTTDTDKYSSALSTVKSVTTISKTN